MGYWASGAGERDKKIRDLEVDHQALLRVARAAYTLWSADRGMEEATAFAKLAEALEEVEHLLK